MTRATKTFTLTNDTNARNGKLTLFDVETTTPLFEVTREAMNKFPGFIQALASALALETGTVTVKEGVGFGYKKDREEDPMDNVLSEAKDGMSGQVGFTILDTDEEEHYIQMDWVVDMKNIVTLGVYARLGEFGLGDEGWIDHWKAMNDIVHMARPSKIVLEYMLKISAKDALRLELEKHGLCPVCEEPLVEYKGRQICRNCSEGAAMAEDWIWGPSDDY